LEGWLVITVLHKPKSSKHSTQFLRGWVVVVVVEGTEREREREIRGRGGQAVEASKRDVRQATIRYLGQGDSRIPRSFFV
jgi:hypothetical protein